jgi:hypothetical protein
MLSGSLFAAGNMNSAPNHNPLLKLDTLETYKLNEVSVTAKHRKTLSAGKAGIREMDLPQAGIALSLDFISSMVHPLSFTISDNVSP